MNSPERLGRRAAACRLIPIVSVLVPGLAPGLLLVALTLPLLALTRPLLAAPSDAPPAVTGITAADRWGDGGTAVVLEWTVAAGAVPEFFMIERAMSEAEVAGDLATARLERRRAAQRTAMQAVLADRGLDDSILARPMAIEPGLASRLRSVRAEAAAGIDALPDDAFDVARWMFVDRVEADAAQTEYRFVVDRLVRGESYRFRVIPWTGTAAGTPAEAAPVTTTLEPVDISRLWFFGIALVFCGAVVAFILIARSGRPLRVRRIAGLEAIDEAVGRATEMGRSVLFVPGIQDMNEMQTIAGITVLSRVAKTAAEYDARVEVPTARSLVMTTARETVQAAFLAAGRPDAYNEDLIYYVTDEQFGYVAYLSGMMVREKPAACIYMGMFYAESLILAETGNSIGAIQVAGTAQPAQLPFFVAACDYTLIGEEFFAASAYLSGSAEELGSLKGQDVGKIIVAVVLVIGVVLATAGAMAGADSDLGRTLAAWVGFLRDTVLA
ncbi:MAG: hypothetical protein KF817_06345 [Phycisphaeraceae bacterium]|nr:hypothetical protein [Phycisphaeraceae bacterium]